MLMGASGSLPGYTFPTGVTLPLNMDVFTNIAFLLVNTPVLQNFSGTLDGGGIQTAVLNTQGPLQPTAVGLTLYCAYLVFGPVDFASNAIAIEIME